MSETSIPTPQNIDQAVALTLAYFDALGMAVSTFEIWQNLIKFQANFNEVQEALTREPLKSQLTSDRGFWSLRDTNEIDQRLTRAKISEFKWRRARATAKALALVPFVTSVSVVNSVALGNAKQDSDIDLFITVAAGRMWLARFLVTGIVNTLGRRRHGNNVANRVCLSFYATEPTLDLAAIAVSADDLYLAHWVTSVGPVWQRRGFDLLEKLDKRNAWVSQLFPNKIVSSISARRRVPRWLASAERPLQALAEKILAGKIGKRLEQRARTFQLRWMNKTVPTEIRQPHAHIIIRDDMLKFHEEDRRVWFREMTAATYARLLASEPLESVAEQPKLSTSGLVIQSIGAAVSA